jgi:hypothetical protein
VKGPTEHTHAAAARVCWRGCGGEGTSTDGVHTYMGAGYDPFCVRESEGLDHARRRVMCWNMCEGAGEPVSVGAVTSRSFRVAPVGSLCCGFYRVWCHLLFAEGDAAVSFTATFKPYWLCIVCYAFG